MSGKHQSCSPPMDGVERRVADGVASLGVTGAAAHTRWSRGAAGDVFARRCSTCFGGSYGGSASSCAASAYPSDAAAAADARRFRARRLLLTYPLPAALPPVRALRPASAVRKPRAFPTLTCMTHAERAVFAMDRRRPTLPRRRNAEQSTMDMAAEDMHSTMKRRSDSTGSATFAGRKQ